MTSRYSCQTNIAVQKVEHFPLKCNGVEVSSSINGNTQVKYRKNVKMQVYKFAELNEIIEIEALSHSNSMLPSSKLF